MAKPPPDKVDEMLKKQQDEFGEPDESEVGVNVEEDLERYIGNEPDEEEPYSIADEVDHDEKRAHHKDPNDATDELINDELDNLDQATSANEDSSEE